MELDGLEQPFVDEIIRQIIDNAMVNTEDVIRSLLPALPDYRQVQGAWMLGEEALDAIQTATTVLGMSIYELVSSQAIPGISDRSGLKYVMEKRVGSDIYLRLLK